MLEPKEHQVRGIKRGVQSNTLEWYDTGTGKTVLGIEIAKQLRQNARFKVSVVVVKKTARKQWQDVIEAQDPGVPVVIWDKASDLEWLAPQQPGWIIMHYDALTRLLPFTAKYQFCVALADEAHRIKNRTAKRSKALKKLKATRKIALTGTPINKHAAEWWSMLNWLDPKKFSSYWRFFNEYVDSTKHPVLGYQIIKGTKNEAQLHAELAPYVVRCRAEDVGEMPEITHTVVRVPITGKQRTLYNRIKKAKDIEVDVHDLRDALAGRYTGFDENSKLYLNAKAKAMRLRQVVNDTRHFEAEGVQLDDPKVAWITEYVEDAPDVPILIFTLYRNEALAIADALAQDGVQPALLLGGTANSEWYTNGVQTISAFTDRKTNVLVGTIDVLAESLDLPFVQVSIFVGIKRDEIMFTQALGRMKRYGSTGTRQAIYLLGEDTIDEADYKAHTEQADDLRWLEIAITEGVFNS